ncbi:hypothetical protein MOQ_006962, partial [Trypanosoma cruzi marinkellei]
LAMGVCVCAWIRCSHVLAGSLQPVPSCQFIGSSMGKRKWHIPHALIPTSSANTLVASRHSSAHPGMRKRDVELSANNATIPAHMSAPPEKTHKLQTTPLTCLPNITPTHCDMPNRTIHHSMHRLTQSNSPCTTHGSSSHTSKQTSALRTSVIHVLRWEVNKTDGLPNPKRVPRLAACQRNAATQNEFSPNALSLPPPPTKAKRAANQTRRPTRSLCKTRRNRSASCCHPGQLWTP